MTDIDKEALAGRWYIVVRDDAKNPLYFNRCVHMEMKLREDGDMDVFGNGHTGFTKYDSKGFEGILWKCG